MENMLPGNSFPQICVVSVNDSVGNRSFKNGQCCSLSKNERTMSFSNRNNNSLVTYFLIKKIS